MAATAEDLARLLVTVELSQARTEKQAAAIAKAASKSAEQIDGSYTAANANVARSFERSGKMAGRSMQVASGQAQNLSFQLNDIAQQLAMGTSPFTVMIQQGSQVAQIFSASGGLGGAVRTLGSAFGSLLNPVGLASVALIGLTGYAAQYFMGVLSGTEDSEEALKKQAELIQKVADKWGDALPALREYAKEVKKAAELGDLHAATEAAVKAQYAGLKGVLGPLGADLANVADIQQRIFGDAAAPGINKLFAAFDNLSKKTKDNSAGVTDLNEVTRALMDMFRTSGNTDTLKLASAFAALADQLARAQKNMQDLRSEQAAMRLAEDVPLGTLSPLTSAGGQFMNPAQLQDYKANNTPSQFEKELEKASGAIDSFVDRVVKAESGGRADAKNPNSSATGAGQFIASTWLDLFRRYYPERAQNMGRDAILELRKDADVSRSLIRAYAKENAAVLQRAGVHVDEAALQLSHFLGAGDAAKVLAAAPGTPLAGLISQASINANPTILGGGRTVDDARSYAERRANAPTGPGRQPKKTPEELFAGDAARVQARIDLINAEIAATQGLTTGVDDYGFAVEKARIKQQLLNDAKQAGLTITPELAASIDTLAGNYAKAAAGAEQLQAANANAANAARDFADFGKDLLGGFISDLRAGKSAAEALANVLNKIADKLLNMALDSLFSGIGGGGGGGGFLGGILGSLFHTGGRVGGPSQKRVVNPGVFAGAPRMHSGGVAGLMPGEVPAILQKGEVVLPRGTKTAGGQETIRVVLQDDSGRMAEIADQQIKTRAGTIIEISTQQSVKAVRKQMPGLIANAQARSM